MSAKPTITNLKSKIAKLQDRPASRTNSLKKPKPSGLASGLTENAIALYRLAKKQQQEQAAAD